MSESVSVLVLILVHTLGISHTTTPVVSLLDCEYLAEEIREHMEIPDVASKFTSYEVFCAEGKPPYNFQDL